MYCQSCGSEIQNEGQPLDPTKCRAAVKSGPRKGQQCQNPVIPNNGGFCKTHHGREYPHPKPRRLLDCITM